MQAEALRGIAVVAMAEGAKLGQVEDVLFDPRELRVLALWAGNAGQRFLVPFDRIASVGTDAITVESSLSTRVWNRGDAFDGLPGLEALRRLKVVDEAGTYLGSVTGVTIDPASGRLLGLAVHKGGVLGIGGQTRTVPAELIRGVGEALVTVIAEPTGPPPAPDADGQLVDHR